MKKLQQQNKHIFEFKSKFLHYGAKNLYVQRNATETMEALSLPLQQEAKLTKYIKIGYNL